MCRKSTGQKTMIKTCSNCRQQFDASFKTATLCKPCYITEKKDERQQLLNDVIYWQTRCFKAETHLALNPPAEQLDVGMIRRLIQLCHPDKHAGSEMAKTVTMELLKMRSAQ